MPGQAPATQIIRRGGRATSIVYRRCSLMVTAGPDTGKTIPIEASRVSIGTSPGADLVLTDPAVSRSHCEIVIEERGFLLRDTNSTNGVLVAGLMTREIYLEPGSAFNLGATRIELQAGEDRAEIRLSSEDHFGSVLGASVKMREIFYVLQKMAGRDVTVLISGETGTGKEIVARSIHDQSPRKEGPFITVDCGSLPENLIEAELFGHARGAFTGASGERAGAFEEADGGTIFLDEIGELPLAQQAKLLRVLEAREVKRLGENSPRTVNVRIVAATNRSLAEEVEAGTFRKDLFFRISVAEIRIPPLRERADDIPLLATHLLGMLSRGTAPQLAPAAIRALSSHPWPGNVRELRNVLEKAVAMAEGDTIDSGVIALGTMRDRSDVGKPGDAWTLDGGDDYSVAHDRFERAYLMAILKKHDMNVTQAARAAGIHRQTIHRLLRKHGIQLDGLR